MISKAFVFVDGLEDKPVVCGVVTLDTINMPRCFAGS